MKFLIITCFDEGHHYGPRYSKLAEIGIPILREYCELNGYDYKIETEDLDFLRPISWSRVYLTRKYLRCYEWVMCVDIDTLIMNHTIKLENIINNDYDVLVAANKEKELNSINTGVILYKNSKWTHDFLNEMYEDKEFEQNGYWEQDTLIKLLKNKPEYFKHINLVRKKLFNSFYHHWFTEDNFKNGDFIVHFPGTSNEFRYKTMEYMKNFVVKPLKMEYNIWTK